VDSFFPSGGFAFSSGLEAAVHGGAVRNVEDLRRYTEDLFLRGNGPCEGVAVGAAHRALVDKDVTIALKADAELDAMRVARESRLAGRQMGRQVIRIAAEQYEGQATLCEFMQAVGTGRTPGHAAVCLGMTLAACGWSREDAVAAYLYLTAIGLVSAGMKLLPIGQGEGQRLLARWAQVIMQSVREGREAREERDVAGMRMWTPVQDIYAMRHARLTTRLFRS
jgi:urease accessory protein